jgi:hypothetical protein
MATWTLLLLLLLLLLLVLLVVVLKAQRAAALTPARQQQQQQQQQGVWCGGVPWGPRQQQRGRGHVGCLGWGGMPPLVVVVGGAWRGVPVPAPAVASVGGPSCPSPLTWSLPLSPPCPPRTAAWIYWPPQRVAWAELVVAKVAVVVVAVVAWEHLTRMGSTRVVWTCWGCLRAWGGQSRALAAAAAAAATAAAATAATALLAAPAFPMQPLLLLLPPLPTPPPPPPPPHPLFSPLCSLLSSCTPYPLPQRRAGTTHPPMALALHPWR